MKIAITADVHLQSGNDERKEAFRRLLVKTAGLGITRLLVAGDFLDKSSGGYKEADQVAASFPDIAITVIPGNHDPVLAGRFASTNIEVISQPTVWKAADRTFLLLPYVDGKPMVESIHPFFANGALEEGRWILISHGDYEGYSSDSGNERGYFVLTGNVLQRYQPAFVFLGHIHVPRTIGERLYYPGSPYPLDITEQGERRILLYNTDAGTVESLYLDYGPVYLHVDLLLIPDGAESEQLQLGVLGAIDRFIAQSSAGETLRKRMQVRVRLRGYTTSMESIDTGVRRAAGTAGVALESILTDELSISDDVDLGRIAIQVKERLKTLELHESDPESLKELVLEKAYKIIYGG